MSGVDSAVPAGRVLCRCRRKCGGPDGPGVPVAYSTSTLHRRQDHDVVETTTGFTEFLASQSIHSNPVPVHGTAVENLKRPAAQEGQSIPKRHRAQPSYLIDALDDTVIYI